MLVGGAGLLALLSASCCVLPIGLSIIGLGGSWLSILGPFVDYRFEVLVLAGIVIAWAWAGLWIGSRHVRPGLAVLLVLSFATLAFVLSVTTPLWERQVSRSLFELWSQTQ